jgi:tetratricopeptide (TPR) repeat protein
MDAQTRWAIGQIQRYLRQGNAAAVIEIVERVLAHDREDRETHRLAVQYLALAYEHLRQWDSALHWLRQGLAIESKNPGLLAARGRVLMKAGKTAEAAALFRDLARRYPNQADYHGAIGSALLRLADVETAIPHLKRARELDPANPYILNDLASAYLLLGDLEASLSAFKQATDHIGPNDRELARDIRQSIEEVRAALVLRRRGVEATAPAKIVDLYPSDPTMPLPAEKMPASDVEPGGRAPTAGEDKVRATLLDALTERGCRPRQLLAALHLWSDFVEALPERERAGIEKRSVTWAAAVVYAIGRLDGAPWGKQREAAKDFRIGPASLSRCFSRIRRALAIEVGDPRYSTVPSRRRAALLERIRKSRIPPERLLLR